MIKLKITAAERKGKKAKHVGKLLAKAKGEEESNLPICIFFCHNV